ARLTSGKFCLLALLLTLGGAGAPLFAQDEPAPADPPSNDAPDTERRIQRLGESDADAEWQPDLAVPSAPAEAAQGEAVLPEPEQNERLQALLRTLAASPGNSRALADLDALLGEVIDQANGLMDERRADEAQPLLTTVRAINPGQRGLRDAERRLETLRETDALLASADRALAAEHLVSPFEGSALSLYRAAQALEPDNPDAERGIRAVQQALVNRALSYAAELDFEAADRWLDEAATVREPQDLVEEGREQVAVFRAQRAEDIEQQALAAMDAGDFTLTEFLIIDLIALGGHEERVTVLQQRLEEARVYGGFEPGQVLRDTLPRGLGEAPPLVVLAAGRFAMGSPSSEEGRGDSEGPTHRVTFERGFALGQREVTVAEFGAFVRDAGYTTEAEEKGKSTIYDERSGRLVERRGVDWQDGYDGRPAEPDQPVVHVSWNDAASYTDWLARTTGKAYRLPSEAEFEYGLRAGTTDRYWWGDDRPPEPLENVTGDGDVSPPPRACSSGCRRYSEGQWGPAPVASYPANPFGLHDMAGNVSEWVEDCWHDTYVRAPGDGSAWVNPGCRLRVVRGGSWAGSPDQARSAFRIAAPAGSTGTRVGFRVARDL
ncbi:MAG: SUMF1/EgtB/PvdO family nonheme iron enzyme, partial [Xanthomonadales bacterium]|nr:SUMF1/EgtB/PvdO family nonheme iron enzyme [Xanthomonadales bacterium]